MKRTIAICLSLLMCVTSVIHVHAQEEYTANSWRYENGQPIVSEEDQIRVASSDLAWKKENGIIYNSLGEPIQNAVSKGIDVSEWQGQIDWDKVKNTDVEFAILRCGFAGDYAQYDDKTFKRNVSECQRLGIPFGVYLYSYAQDVQDAKAEAAHVLRLIQGLNLSYPVFYDLEDNSNLTAVNNGTIADVAKTFVDTIESHGYRAGIYANLYWFNNLLTDPYFDTVTTWIAQYNAYCDYTKPYIIWQSSSTGNVDGIDGPVDINISFEAINQSGWKFENGSWYYYLDANTKASNQWIGNYYVNADGTMAKNQWIGNCYVDENGLWQENRWMNDGKWWYRYGDGTYPVNKFVEINGSNYYFNGDGYIVTGWKEIQGKWYYFNDSGAMVKGQWVGNYYLEDDGTMATNKWIGNCYVDSNGLWTPSKWVLQNGKYWYRHQDGSYTKNGFELINGQWYLFDKNGYMLTGWQDFENERYYFKNSGAMVKNTWVNNYYLGSNGKMVKDKWIGDYYVDKDGKLATSRWVGKYYVDSTGLWIKDSWMQTNGKWWYRYGDGQYPIKKFDVIANNTYYFDEEGYMVTGWQTIGKDRYYFDVSGIMVKNQWVDDCYLDAYGKMIEG